MHQSVVEVGSGICQNIQQAREELRNLRCTIIGLARENGLRRGRRRNASVRRLAQTEHLSG